MHDGVEYGHFCLQGLDQLHNNFSIKYKHFTAAQTDI